MVSKQTLKEVERVRMSDDEEFRRKRNNYFHKKIEFERSKMELEEYIRTNYNFNKKENIFEL